LSAQSKFTVSGTVKDAKSGESLIGVVIRLKHAQIGTTTNEYGFYSLTLPAGRDTLVYIFIGYQAKEIPLNLTKNMKQNIELGGEGVSMKEVQVSAQKPDDNVKSTEMSEVKVDIREANKIPVIFGEKDILKTIQLMPGIKSAGDGNAGFYVRGGSADQNLILLDEATVYNASHLLGFFSVFNSDAIKEVTVFKGGMPAQYGGRVSSVLDIRMNDGNDKEYHVSGGIGIIASRLTVEGPIVKDKGSFIISARRTYADLFLKLSKDSITRKSRLYFYDVNVKANYTLGQKDRLFLSGYFGKDDFGLGSLLDFNWGNATGTLRWNHIFTDKLFLNSSFIVSNYSYNIQINQDPIQVTISSSIRDYSLKEDFSYYVNPNNTLKFGVQSTYHTFVPGSISANIGAASSESLATKYAWENAGYLQDEIKLSGRLSTNIGVRLSSFTLLGPGTFYTYDKNGDVTDSSKYGNNQGVKTYYGFEPRASLAYILTETSSLKASYTRNNQYLHLLSNSITSSPTDLWIPSSNNVHPQIGDQYALGYFRNFEKNTYETSVELYYKNMWNLIDYKNGAQLNFNKYVESQLVYGRGYAYGAEFFVRKKYGQFTGWVGYTLSRTFRVFPDINNGNKFPARQDQIHNLSVVGMYDLNKKWSFSASFVFNTGDAVTFPSGTYDVEGKSLPYYTERNGYRMRPYNRLDLSATVITKKTAKFESSWNFSVYNAYFRENPYIIFFQQDPNNANKMQAVQIALFRAVPSITYNFKF
jgi:hypothetical protein